MGKSNKKDDIKSILGTIWNPEDITIIILQPADLAASRSHLDVPLSSRSSPFIMTSRDYVTLPCERPASGCHHEDRPA